jgi:DNA-binding transcriptional LysR family regulator
MITFLQLRAFLAIARHRHFTRAAEDLAVAQSSVSYQLRELERHLGVRLVEVVGHRVYLTDAGERFVTRATGILNDLESAEAELRRYGEGVAGRVRLGATHTVGSFALPPVLAAFRQTYPQIELRLAIENVRSVEAMLLDRTIDLGVVEWTVRSPELVSHSLRRYAIVVIAPPSHRLAGRLRVRRADLRGETFVFRELGSGTRALSEEVLGPVTGEITVAMELTQPEAIVRAVEAGMGLAFIPEIIAAPQIAAGTVRVVSLADTQLSHDFALVTVKNRTLTPAGLAFQDFLIERLTD